MRYPSPITNKKPLGKKSSSVTERLMQVVTTLMSITKLIAYVASYIVNCCLIIPKQPINPQTDKAA